MKLLLLFSLFCISDATTRATWQFNFFSKQKAPAAARIFTISPTTMDMCAAKCTETKHCQSVSYNKNTKQCILQATLSTDKYLKPVDDADFMFGDMIPGLPMEETLKLCTLLSPCINNGTCKDVNGPEYECHCNTGFGGKNCNEEMSVRVVLIAGYLSNVSIEMYDIKHPENSTTVSLELYPDRRYFGAAQMSDGKVVIAGGYGTVLSDHHPTYLYDPHNQNITSAGLVILPVGGNSAAVLNDVPIFCGGYDFDLGSTISTCKKLLFNSTTQNWNWELMASMQTARVYLAMVSHSNKAYAIGGELSASALNSVERYDMTTDTWEYIANMNTSRNHAGAAVLNDNIYVCGGHGLATCERYSVAQNVWTDIPDMGVGRRGPHMAVVYGKVYVLGGEMTYKKVQEYDPVTNQWTTKADMITDHAYGSTAILV